MGTRRLREAEANCRNRGWAGGEVPTENRWHYRGASTLSLLPPPLLSPSCHLPYSLPPSSHLPYSLPLATSLPLSSLFPPPLLSPSLFPPPLLSPSRFPPPLLSPSSSHLPLEASFGDRPPLTGPHESAGGSDGDLPLELIELPRLQLTFEARRATDGKVRLHSVEHPGLHVGWLPGDRLQTLLRGMPHALVLLNEEVHAPMRISRLNPLPRSPPRAHRGGSVPTRVRRARRMCCSRPSRSHAVSRTRTTRSRRNCSFRATRRAGRTGSQAVGAAAFERPRSRRASPG